MHTSAFWTWESVVANLTAHGSQSEHGKAEDTSQKVRSHNASRPDMHVERGKNQATGSRFLLYNQHISRNPNELPKNRYELPQLSAVVISHPMKMTVSMALAS